MNVTIDDLLYVIGKMTVEKEMLVRTNEALSQRIAELEARQAGPADEDHPPVREHSPG